MTPRRRPRPWTHRLAAAGLLAAFLGLSFVSAQHSHAGEAPAEATVHCVLAVAPVLPPGVVGETPVLAAAALWTPPAALGLAGVDTGIRSSVRARAPPPSPSSRSV